MSRDTVLTLKSVKQTERFLHLLKRVVLVPEGPEPAWRTEGAQIAPARQQVTCVPGQLARDTADGASGN